MNFFHFQAWPDDALARVAHSFLKDVDIEAKERESVVKLCKYFHLTIREQSVKYVFNPHSVSKLG